MNILDEMRRLMIIADDFTGALDTGVQFSCCGAKPKFILNPTSDFSLNADADVAIVNSETRHLEARRAYQIVYDISKRAYQSGFDYIYKKVDSGLRGNIGSELSAVMDATGIHSLHFIPAYPKHGRITKDGKQYIDGVLLDKSVFASDPLNPPISASIKQIVSSQCGKNVILNSSIGDGIHIYDAETENDMAEIAACIGHENIKVSAGCAGFAPYLATLLGYDKQKDGPTAKLSKPVLIISGSINPVTQAQIKKAEKYGIKRHPLTVHEKTDRAWVGSAGYHSFITSCLESIYKDGCAIIDMGDNDCIVPKNPDVSRYVVSLISTILNSLFERDLDALVFVIGGDTLKAIADSLGIQEICPIAELQPGIVLNSAFYRGKKLLLISKSGGFGCEDSIVDVLKDIR